MTTRFDILPGLTPTVVFETGTTFEVVPGGVLTETATTTYTLSLASGAYALTGSTATVFATRKLSAATGSYALTGSAATLIKSYVLAEATGAYTLTGTTLATLTTRKLPGVTGTYTLTGSAATTFVTRKLAAASGTYFLTGSSATPKLTLKLPLATGAYSLTGSTAATFVTRKLTATSGSYVITGSTATTVVTRKLAAATGAFALTGSAAQVFVTRKLAAASGSYVINGQTATLTLTATGHYTLAGDTGHYTLSGSTGTLVKVDGSVTTGNIYTVSGPQVVGYLPLQDGVDQVRAVNFPGSTVQRQTTDGTVGPVPAFQTDLTALSALPAQISFSRASNATMFDSTGKLTYAPNNMLLNSNDFTQANWSKISISITPGVADPLGGSSASTITATGAVAEIVQTLFSQPLGVNWVGTIWMRRRTGSGSILFYTPDDNTTTPTLTSSWQQFSTNSPTRGVGTVYLDLVINTSGDAIDIYAPTMSQVTYETTARSADQVITTASAYYGPRFDHNPSTLAATGLLIEEARTNAVLQSTDLSNGAWQLPAGASSVAHTGATNKAGSTSWRLTATTVSAVHGIQQQVTFAAGILTIAIDAKYVDNQWIALAVYDSGYQAVSFDILNGVAGVTGAGLTSTMKSLGGGWYRITATYTAAGANPYFALFLQQSDSNSVQTWTPSSAVSVDIDFPQLESGAFATSYIPTTSATATRSADIAQLTGAALTALQGSAASVLVEAQSSYLINFSTTRAILGMNGTRDIIGVPSGETARTSSDDGIAILINSIFASGDVISSFRSGIAGDVSGRSFSNNGTTIVSDANAAFPSATSFAIGSKDGSIDFINGWVRSLAIYSSRLSDATLQIKSVVGAAF